MASKISPFGPGSHWPFRAVAESAGIAQYASKVLFFTVAEPAEVIEEVGKLAETARRESVFALEKVPIDDPFLKKAMTLAADNRPPEVIQAILQLEIDSMEDRHKRGKEVLDGIGADGYEHRNLTSAWFRAGRTRSVARVACSDRARYPCIVDQCV